jgi:hypothetical protein
MPPQKRQRHHYVPVFYQKQFAFAGKLWKYDRRYQSYNHCSPKENCFEWDLYAVYPKNGGEDRRIETDVLSQIDNAAAPIIRQLSPGVRLSAEDTRLLVRFIGLQYTRMPSFARAVKALVEANMDEWLQISFGTAERAEQAIRAVEKETGEPQNIEAHSMVEAVKGRRIKAHANETMFLDQMFLQANTLGHWLEESAAWTLLVAPQTTGFILSDQPFVSVPSPGALPEAISYGTPGATTYVPLKRSLCLQVRSGYFDFRYQHVDSRIVRMVNHNIAANSERFILAADRPQLESVLEKSGSACMDEGERFNIEVIRPDQDNTFVKFVMKPRRYFY